MIRDPDFGGVVVLETDEEVMRYCLHWTGNPVSYRGVFRWWRRGGTFSGALEMWRLLWSLRRSKP